VSSVERIAAALDVPVAQLWAPARSGDAVRIVRSDEGAIAEHGAEILRTLPEEAGAPALREWSARNRRWPTERDIQRGEVAIYVARGSIEIDLDGEIHPLVEGDTVRFDGSIPHRLRRTGGTTTRALIITS
jgi:hypothetical protein